MRGGTSARSSLSAFSAATAASEASARASRRQCEVAAPWRRWLQMGCLSLFVLSFFPFLHKMRGKDITLEKDVKGQPKY